jgi:hypothetical protein
MKRNEKENTEVIDKVGKRRGRERQSKYIKKSHTREARTHMQ